jgi:hypothetical protein
MIRCTARDVGGRFVYLYGRFGLSTLFRRPVTIGIMFLNRHAGPVIADALFR